MSKPQPAALGAPGHAAPTPDGTGRAGLFLALALGSAGVVYGDIGTSLLYAFKESISHLRGADGAIAPASIIGVISLMFWSLMAIVTIKYVFILMRFSNRGEGGVLSLMALVQKAGRGGAGILFVGMLGAGLFFGDAILTPAVSVLSAVEGLTVIDGIGPRLQPLVVPLALVILVALFAIQRRGTGAVGRFFGPACVVWFLTIAALGVPAILAAPEILQALSPAPGLALLVQHPLLAPAILGSVFLTVTGAEALYADMGHFGRRPIQVTWLALVFPCLMLNYLGQGALVLEDAAAASNPFFYLAPGWFQIPLVLLATVATVIASQAVISGAFSLTRQAIQLGILPRMALTSTSENHAGQIYAPQVNWMLLAGVALLVVSFGSSSALASAYGVSVVGAMITSSFLALVAMRRVNGRPLWQAALVLAPFLALEGAFAAANLTKVAHGGWMPLALAAGLIVVMLTWRRGSARLAEIERDDLSVADLIPMLASRQTLRARGTAVYLTRDPDVAPAALLHNLKHNQVLHEEVVLLTLVATQRPRVPDAERVSLHDLGPGFRGMTLAYGFMETPNVAHALTLARAKGLKLDIMRTSFFLSRRTLLVRGRGLGRLQGLLFAFLARNAERAADYFRIPPSRVVELGAQITL
ncbi:MAG: potassium transporter Kup [Phenylobacterium sp.]|nr:potassium transporter Kup [Phenylobacterium sp.]